MSAANDPRLGTLNADGSVQAHPSVNLMGQPYERPAGATLGLGDGYFVVLPAHDRYADALAEVQALIAPQPVKKGKAADDAAE